MWLQITGLTLNDMRKYVYDCTLTNSVKLLNIYYIHTYGCIQYLGNKHSKLWLAGVHKYSFMSLYQEFVILWSTQPDRVIISKDKNIVWSVTITYMVVVLLLYSEKVRFILS